MARRTIQLAALSACLGACACGAHGPSQEVEPIAAERTTTQESFAAEPAARILPDGDYGAFPETVRVADRTLALRGAGLCEWGVFGIDLYRAALYAERADSDTASLLDSSQPVLFHLHFVRELSREQLGAAYTAAVEANAGDRIDDFRPALKLLVDRMPDVKVGDGLTFLSVPDDGLLLQANGIALGTIEDEAFRALFVELYLGDKPPTEALKRAFLTGGR